jgi:nicotinate-nucleotide adenylyltransferase
MVKRVAIFGGSFNPITKAHIKIVGSVLNLEIDEVWIMPCYTSYNKKLLSAKHRIAMCEMVITDSNNVKVCNFEIKNQSNTSINTMSKLHELYNYDFYLIIGMDNANKINTWTNYKELIKTCKFIVITRENYISTNDWFMNKPHILVKNFSSSLSSTEFRDKYGDNEDVSHIINLKVMDYIKKHNLY